jgi:hypothetical protein
MPVKTVALGTRPCAPQPREQNGTEERGHGPPRPVTDRHRCCVTHQTRAWAGGRCACHPRSSAAIGSPVSAVICYDGNFNDLVRPAARAGGVLAIPANDWKETEQLHSPSAVSAAVMTGVPLIQSTGHGRSVVSGRRRPARGDGQQLRWASRAGHRHAHPHGAPRNRGGDRIGPSIQRSGCLRNDSLKANGGGGIGVAAPAQSIACPPLSPWPWVSRVQIAHAALQLARASKIAPGRLQLHLTYGAAPVF